MQLPTISNYGQYGGDNYGEHTLQLEFENFRLYYSYKTIVAYHDHQEGLVCCENVWGTTTGKHLNWIQPDKKKRIKPDDFQSRLKNMLERRTK